MNYNTIIEYLESETTLEGEEKEKRDALVLAAHLNLAACELRLGEDTKVIEHCNSALDISKDNAKAFFRRAQVKHCMQEITCIYFFSDISIVFFYLSNVFNFFFICHYNKEKSQN